MKLREMIKDLEIEAYENHLTEAQIPEVEKWLGVKLGQQLKEYILGYSSLYSEEFSVELLTIVPEVSTNSEMVDRTQYLHQKYRGTENYVVIEADALEEVDVVVDTEDNVFYIDGNDLSLINPGMKLFDYLYFRLKYGDWLFMSDKERAEVEMSEEDRQYFAENCKPV